MCDTFNKYHDLNCCDLTRGIDTLLSRYKQDREEITTLMLTDPDQLIEKIWKHDGPLAIDNSCQCKMGEGEKRSQYACAQCKNMRRIMDLRKAGIDVPFQIECGSMAGKRFILRQREVPQPFLKHDPEAANRARIYLKQYKELLSCGTPDLSGLKCISGDSFTTRTLILWMIQKLFAEQGLNHSPTLHTAFICHNKGYSLYNMPTIGTFKDLIKNDKYISRTGRSDKPEGSEVILKSKIAKSIILQLLVIFTELSSINFSHGDPSMNGLIFNDDPVSYKYNKTLVSGPITMQISDLWNSSITVSNTHYFASNVKTSIFLENRLFVPEIVTKLNEDALFYRLTNSTLDIYTAMRHIGFPLYVGSFDFYCFMVALMQEHAFYGAVVANDELYGLWTKMWLTDDLSQVELLLKDPLLTPVDVIKGSWLRCDILDFMWELVESC